MVGDDTDLHDVGITAHPFESRMTPVAVLAQRLGERCLRRGNRGAAIRNGIETGHVAGRVVGGFLMSGTRSTCCTLLNVTRPSASVNLCRPCAVKRKSRQDTVARGQV